MGPSRIDKNVCSLLILFTCLLFSGFATAGVSTDVIVNKSVLLNLPKPSERVSIATPAIAELIVISPTQLQINGTKIGTTSLIVWEKGGKTSFFDIRVKGDISHLEKQIREIAPNDSITVDYANDTIVLSGKAANDQTIEKAVQIATAYAAKEAPASPVPGSGPPVIPRQGEPPDKKPATDSKVKILNHIQVDDPQQVLLEVKVAQVDKNAMRSLGFSMLIKGAGGEGFLNMVGSPDGSIAGNIKSLGGFNSPGSPLESYQLGGSVFKSGIGGVLKALSTKALAKILAEPNMLVRSGQEGNFLAGKKFYFPIVSNDTTDVKEITVGIKLKFKPVVLENGVISLKIDPAEVSSISGFMPVNNYPIVDSREIRSDVQLKDGESLVLAGLLQEETIKSMSKIPILGDIPILGALFRSTEDELKEKELVFFITPRLIKANAPGVVLKLPTDKPLTSDEEKELKWMPLIN